MDTFSPWAPADLEPQLSASGQAELRDAVLRQHATLPFYPGTFYVTGPDGVHKLPDHCA